MKVSLIRFPGSNCDHDIEHLYGNLLQAKVETIWHKEHDLKNPDIVVLPGGFSYGDYLRTGALARVSPVMQEVRKFADKGGKVIGICNGFQILCECMLLPGALLKNIKTKFLSHYVHIRVERSDTPFTTLYKKGDVITCPVAHGEGNYFADPDTIKKLEDEGQIIFRYCSKDGVINHQDLSINPNGSINSIAGVSNKQGNVVGLMPHPERSAEKIVGYIGGDTGFDVFRSVLN